VKGGKDKKRGRDEPVADGSDDDGDGDDDGSVSDSDGEFADFEKFLDDGAAGDDNDDDDDDDDDEDGEGLFAGSDAEAGAGEETLQERLRALHAALKTAQDEGGEEEEEEEEEDEEADGAAVAVDGADGQVSDKRKRLLEKEQARVAGMVRASEVPKASA
jgi:hypothetical protein